MKRIPLHVPLLQIHCGKHVIVKRGQTLLTDIIILVMTVPVLSEQMTEVQPSVSTDGKLLTMVFFLAMHILMTAGRPSGMAATEPEGNLDGSLEE
jgi:hypothetical protein